MVKILTLAMVAASLHFLSPGAASAATIVNKDKQGHKLMILDRKGAHKSSIKPEQKIEMVCKHGCILRLDNNPDAIFQLEGNENVTIENGLVYYNGEQRKPAPKPKQSKPPTKR